MLAPLIGPSSKRLAVEEGRAVEGEGRVRPLRREERLPGRELPFPGSEVVLEERFRVFDASGLKGLGERGVDAADPGGVEQRSQRFANTVVVKLDVLGRAAAA